MFVDVCGKGVWEYVALALSDMNKNEGHVTLRAAGRNISPLCLVSSILSSRFEASVENSELEIINHEGSQMPVMTAEMKISKIGLESWKGSPCTDDIGFASFIAYHLAIDRILRICNELKLKVTPGGREVTITVTNTNAKSDDQDFTVSVSKCDKDVEESILSAFYRSGLVSPQNKIEIANELSNYDDIIIGADTNILQDCVLSEHLLSSLSFLPPRTYAYVPNWILIIIPTAVMHELELLANSRNDKNYLSILGRLGYRGLQEVMDLSGRMDIPGLSVVITGDFDPSFESRVEIQALRQDLFKLYKDMGLPGKGSGYIGKSTGPYISPKLSTGDMAIRHQFRKFLGHMNFHKGIYFLTEDKTNAALARTEGINSLLCKRPFPGPNFLAKRDPERVFIGGKEFLVRVPIGKIVYDLCVAFEGVSVTWKCQGKKEETVLFLCDIKGESPDPWKYRELITKDFNTLKESYNETGPIIPLEKACSVWKSIEHGLFGDAWGRD